MNPCAEIPESEGGAKSEEPRQASLPDLLVTKAKQTGASVTFIEDAALLSCAEPRSLESFRQAPSNDRKPWLAFSRRLIPRWSCSMD